MSIETVIAEIDAEIARLQQAHTLLAGMAEAARESPVPAKKVAKRRQLSAAARERMAAAQRKRWDAVRKAAK
jgi:hypothetical protein